jgi:hypothetical protein
MVSLAESSIVIYLWTIPLNSLLLSELDRVASVPGANATSGPRCRRQQLFGFLAPAAVNTLRLKQPRH